MEKVNKANRLKKSVTNFSMPEQYNDKSYVSVLSRIDQNLTIIASDVKEMKDKNEGLEKRVSSLENFKYYLAGIVAVISTFSSYIITKWKSGG